MLIGITMHFTDVDHIDDPDSEFTTCEFCCAFSDYKKLMTLTESMISGEIFHSVYYNNHINLCL